MNLHHSQGCENGVFGESQTWAELKSLSNQCSWIPCQWMQMQSVEPKPSPPMALLWLTALHNTKQYKQHKQSQDTGNTSFIWMTFRTKKSVGSQKLCSNSLSFEIKGIRVSFHLFLMSIFIRVHQLQKISFFSMPYPMQLASTFWGSQCLMQNSVNIPKWITKILLHFSQILSPKRPVPKRRGISFLSVSTHLESFSAGIRRDVWIRAVSKYKGYWMKTHTSVKGNNSL